MARDIGSVGNGNTLVLLVFIIAEVIGNSSIEYLNIAFGSSVSNSMSISSGCSMLLLDEQVHKVLKYSPHSRVD